MKKSVLWGGGVFAGVFALLCAVLYIMGMLEDGMLFMAAVFALIACLITVAVLTGQLKQAASVQTAHHYAMQESFRLSVNMDYYLHTTQTRRRIEQRPAGPGKR